jgi:hypothetical protein
MKEITFYDHSTSTSNHEIISPFCPPGQYSRVSHSVALNIYVNAFHNHLKKTNNLSKSSVMKDWVLRITFHALYTTSLSQESQWYPHARRRPRWWLALIPVLSSISVQLNLIIAHANFIPMVQWYFVLCQT